jgi:hypothetical protein
MLNLALCYENLGKVASACSMWREAAAGAGQKAQVDRESWAREHVQKVCPRVPVVTIDVAEQPGRDRLEITLDGAPVTHAQWGKPMTLDPGEYDLRATGDGLQPWSSKVSIDDRPVPAVIVPVLTLPALAAPAAAPPLVLPAPSTGGPETAAADRRSPSRAAALATGAAGLAALGVSAGFGIAALVNERASNSGRNCVANECNPTGAQDRSRAIHDAQISDVTLGVGAGAVVVGVVLWLIAPRAAERASASGVVVQPTVAQGAWALAVGGVWR